MECKWKKPSQSVQKKYQQGKRIEEFYKPEKKQNEYEDYDICYQDLKEISCTLSVVLREEEERLCRHSVITLVNDILQRMVENR